MQPTTNKEAALSLASMGLRIFPCNGKKKPMVSDWEQAATSSPFSLGMTWETHPEALPAIPVGAHGFLVIDCD